MTKQEKIQVVDAYVGIFEKPGVFLMDFKGLSVLEMTELRNRLREANISMRVVKNTLAKRALKQVGKETFETYLNGPVGVIWSQEDSVAPARVLIDFIKKYEKGVIKGGFIEGGIFTPDQVVSLSKLPPKQELYARLASSLNASIVKLAVSLNALPSNLVRTLDAVRIKMSQEN
jgi:large subunit ribosomal protein L10